MLKPFPAWYANAFAGDGFLILLLALEGKIHYSNELLSVYRHNENSISNYINRVEINENFEKHFKLFDEHSGYKFSKEIKNKLFALKFNLNYYNNSYPKKLIFFFIKGSSNHVAQIPTPALSIPNSNEVRVKPSLGTRKSGKSSDATSAPM